MKNDKKQSMGAFAVLGILPVVWFALLTAPYLSGGMMEVIQGVPEAMNHPFSISICKESVKTVVRFFLAYGLGLGIYVSSRSIYS